MNTIDQDFAAWDRMTRAYTARQIARGYADAPVLPQRRWLAEVIRAFRTARDMAALFFGALLLCVGAWEFRE